MRYNRLLWLAQSSDLKIELTSFLKELLSFLNKSSPSQSLQQIAEAKVLLKM